MLIEKKNTGLLSLQAMVRNFGLLLFFISSYLVNAQVTSSIDSTKIKIGEQITYTIEVQADSTDQVLFPEGQSFMPLEMI